MEATNLPLVTIGIPTYNRAGSYLKYSLESALNQTYPNIEIIVADNCSNDGTMALVSGYNDERIRYHRHESRLKAHENADFCLNTARGEYFLLLHDDDLVDRDFVETCMAAARGKDVGFIHTGARKIDGDGHVVASRVNPHRDSTTWEYFKAVVEGKAVTYFCNNLYNTKYLRMIGGFHSRTYTYQDVVTNIRMAHLYGRVDIEKPMASYRKHNSKLGSLRGIRDWCEDSLYILDVMAELMPEHQGYFQGEGKTTFSRRNYGRAIRMTKPVMRPYAYHVVYRTFHYSYSPFRFHLDRIKKKLKQRIKDVSVEKRGQERDSHSENWGGR